MEPLLIKALVVFGITYALIISEKMDRTAAAILGASTVIFLGLIPYHKAMETVDLNVVFLLVGMMAVVNLLSDTGLFEWVAVFIAQRARGNAIIILLGLLVATAVLSAFLDNVTTVVLIAPITILITQILEIPAIPFLILEALFSNIGGTATLVGDPPNILIGSKGGLTFNEFLIHLSPIVVIIMIICLVPVFFLFRRSLRASRPARHRIMRAQPRRAITDPMRLKRGLVVFFAILVGFCVCHTFHMEPGIVALGGAFLMLIVCKSNIREAMERVEWETIFFLIGLFILVGSLEHQGLFEILGNTIFNATHDNFFLASMAILWSGALLSAAFGNIPVVMAMIPLVGTMIPAFSETLSISDPEEVGLLVAQPLWWSLALGTCLGGNGSLFGAAANIVVSQVAKKNDYKISFWSFTQYGLPVMMLTLLLCSAYIYVRYFLLLHA